MYKLVSKLVSKLVIYINYTYIYIYIYKLVNSSKLQYFVVICSCSFPYLE